MNEDMLAVGLAIAETLHRLASLEPLIARLADGSIVAFYVDAQGELCSECVHAGEARRH